MARKKKAPLLPEQSPVAERQAKTDRLFLARFVKEAADSFAIDEDPWQEAHKILIKWAEMESSGRLATQNETQLQGKFLEDVFSRALGYTWPTENTDVWHLEQHHEIAGQTPDAILGLFRHNEKQSPLTVIELKGPKVHLDRDRSNGRTAIDQLWDYIVNTPPTCRWGIASNMVSFRLYERDSTKRKYEHFTLQDLRKESEFRRFYAIFRRKGLIEGTALEEPKAFQLLEKTQHRQREAGDKLYEAYSRHRLDFIQHLYEEHDLPLETAIEYAQRLLDRVIFIAFCEDRGLLPTDCIKRAYEELPAFSHITNPRWTNFKTLFRFVDEGQPSDPNRPNGTIPAYSGGLFAVTDADDLELDDQWTNFFNDIAGYDFADEVNLDVLGHLFERSITELEKLKSTGVYGDAEKAEQYATMPQSAKRKRLGIYYTPPELTSRIVQYTVDELIAQRFADLAVEHGIKKADARRGIAPDDPAYWQACLAVLQNLKVVDPACGSGAFLFQAYNVLEQRYLEVIGHIENGGTKKGLAEQVPQWILQHNLYGVDLSPEAVEITQLALWIRSATRGQTLATLSKNIVHGNSLVHDPEVAPDGFDWRERFPEVFDREEPGFDCVIGNPPWERIKLQNREFFSMSAPEVLQNTNAAKQREAIAALEETDPELFERYKKAYDDSHRLLEYSRKSGDYPLTGRGDINTYAVFTELANKLVSPNGRVGLLVPSGIAFDHTTKDFFSEIAESNRLIRLFDFENKKIYFPDVHASYKYCILNFGGSAVTTEAADFMFFIHRVEELEEQKRHIPLSGEDISLLNPNTHTCPIFRSRQDAEVTKSIYRRVQILVDDNREGPTGNPWGVNFKRMFDQSNDAALFHEVEALESRHFSLLGNRWTKGEEVFLPLYEAKMFRPYDHRYGSAYDDTSNWTNQGQTIETNLVQYQNPEFRVLPRWWVDESKVVDALVTSEAPALLAFRDITRATDWRTFIATMLPLSAVVHKAPIIRTDTNQTLELCLLANLNSIPLDYCTKQKSGGISLTFFIVKQLPVLPPDTYAKPCPWEPGTTLEAWVSERVLKLTCTAEDMLPLADACGFTSGSFQNEYGGRLNKWDEAERAQLTAELDAAYFHLYGINRDDAEYILSTFKGIHEAQPLIPESRTTAEHILALYDQYTP